jgi:hypothetical protein
VQYCSGAEGEVRNCTGARSKFTGSGGVLELLVLVVGCC